MTKELNSRFARMEDIPAVLVLGNPMWRPALVGLAANKLAEEHQRPVFLWGRDGNGVIKGSCRSGGHASVVTLMDAVADVFIEHGGHHFSGGFSVADDAIFSLPDRLNEAYEALGEKATIKEDLLVDADLKLSDINQNLLEVLRSLAPYGVGNAKPLFSFTDVIPSKVEQFGKAKEHLKLVFESDGKMLEAIAFFSNAEQYELLPKEGEKLTLIAHVEESYFMNRHQVRLRVVDVLKTL